MFITIGKQDWRYFTVAGDDPNKQTRNEFKLRGVCRSRLDEGLFYGSAKQENHGKPKVAVNGDLIPNSKDQNL